MISLSIKEIKAYLLFDLIPKRLFSSGVDWSSTHNFRSYMSKFELGDSGTLYINKKNTKIQVLEEDNSAKFLAFEAIHNVKHMQFKSTLHKLQEHYYWDGMVNDVKTWINCCKICQENRKNSALILSLVLTDHSYSFMNKNTEGLILNQNLVSANTDNLKLITDEAGSSKLNEKSEAEVKKDDVTVKNPLDIGWDHDYVADELTKRRKVQAVQKYKCLAEKNKSKLRNKVHISDNLPPRRISNIDESINTACKVDYVPLKFPIKPDITFIPEDSLQFLPMLGLETVVNFQMNVQLDNPVLLPCSCVRCKTDCTPSWVKCGQNAMCTSCHKYITNAERASNTFSHFQEYRKKCNAELKAKKRRRAMMVRRTPLIEISKALERKRNVEGLLRSLVLQHKTNRFQFLNPPKSHIESKRNNFYLQMQLLNARRKMKQSKRNLDTHPSCRDQKPTLVFVNQGPQHPSKRSIPVLYSKSSTFSSKPCLIAKTGAINQRSNSVTYLSKNADLISTSSNQITRPEQARVFRFPSATIPSKVNLTEAFSKENSKRRIIQTVKLKNFLVNKKIPR